jgi:ribosomal protein S18 acetylase RimI-like enzyme
MDDLKVVFDSSEEGPAMHRVKEALIAFNFAATGVSAWYPVNYYLRSPRDELMGGLTGMIWGGWLHVSFLWIDEAVRGKGHATRLMDEAEAYARERHCHSATLDTHSFQARPFYEKRGYQVIGTLDDYPKGHKKFFLSKKL